MVSILLFQFENSRVSRRNQEKFEKYSPTLFLLYMFSTLSLFKLGNVIIKVQGVGIS